jgi:hypothetical protein
VRTEILQIHCQESDVIQSIDVAKAVVEFKAIEHPRPVRQAEDVVANEITVTIDDASFGHALLEQDLTTGEESFDKSFDLVRSFPVQHAAVERSDLAKAGAPPGAQGIPPTLTRDFR